MEGLRSSRTQLSNEDSVAPTNVYLIRGEDYGCNRDARETPRAFCTLQHDQSLAIAMSSALGPWCVRGVHVRDSPFSPAFRQSAVAALMSAPAPVSSGHHVQRGSVGEMPALVVLSRGGRVRWAAPLSAPLTWPPHAAAAARADRPRAHGSPRAVSVPCGRAVIPQDAYGDDTKFRFSWRKLWAFTGPGFLMSIAYLVSDAAAQQLHARGGNE